MSATRLEIDDGIIKNQLLLNEFKNDEIKTLFPTRTPNFTIVPEPGICVKTKNNQTFEKVFINVCVSEAVPAPEDITNEELISVFESDNPSDFKIPMSIGPQHVEEDKAGCACSAYDIVIHPSFLDKVQDNPLFHNFFMIVAIEGLDHKYDLALDKNCWTLLKNKKYQGSLANQKIRLPHKPLVQELSGIRKWTNDNLPPTATDKATSPSKSPELIREVSSLRKSKAEVAFRSVEGGSSLQAEVQLPEECTSASGIRVAVGQDGIVITTPYPSAQIHDVPLPGHMSGRDSLSPSVFAFFVRPTKVLVIRIEVSPPLITPVPATPS